MGGVSGRWSGTPLRPPSFPFAGFCARCREKLKASLANDVQSAVIPGAGHWFAEEAPEETVAALTAFLAPYRDRVAVLR